MECRWLRERGEFDALAEEWDALLRQSAFQSPYLSHAWLGAWQEHLGSGSLAILALERRRTLAGAAPCVQRRWLGFRLLEGMGIRGASVDGADLLLPRGREAECLALLLDALLAHPREWDLLTLPGVRTSSAVWRALAHVPAELLTRFTWEFLPRAPTRAVPLDRPWGDYLAERGRLRRQCAYWERRWDQLAGGALRVAEGEAAVRVALPECAAVEAESWKRRGGFCRFHGPRAAFTQSALVRIAATGRCCISLAYQDARPIAYLIAIAAGERLAAFDTAHLAAYRPFMPGITLLRTLLAREMCGAHRWLDLGAGWEEYKRLWSPHVEISGTLTLARAGDVRSQLALHVWSLARQLGRSLRRWVRGRRLSPAPPTG